eukprot:sb/3479234/
MYRPGCFCDVSRDLLECHRSGIRFTTFTPRKKRHMTGLNIIFYLNPQSFEKSFKKSSYPGPPGKRTRTSRIRVGGSTGSTKFTPDFREYNPVQIN